MTTITEVKHKLEQAENKHVDRGLGLVDLKPIYTMADVEPGEPFYETQEQALAAIGGHYDQLLIDDITHVREDAGPILGFILEG